MLKRTVVLSVLTLMIGAAQAQAQSYGTRNAGENFTGPYLGGTFGYSWGDFDGDGVFGGVSASDDADMDGWQGGVIAGYGFQFNPGFADRIWNGYLGFEAGYEWSNADGNSFAAGIDKDESLLITLRPGLAWGDTALGYGIIGYSRTRFEAGNDDDWYDGLVLGLGTELTTVGPFKTRIEYVYTNYEDKTYDLGAGNTLKLDGHENALKVGALYRF